MKKVFLALSFATLLIGPAAYAQGVGADVNVAVKATTTGSVMSAEHRNENDQASSSNSAHATGTAESNTGHASTSASVSGMLTAEAHRSAVATFVQSLLKTANRDGGIGAEVRVVAQSQNNHASTTVEAMQKVENRSKLVSFLFGTDWNSIGSIRNAIVQNDADMQNLEHSASLTTNASVRAELTAEIQALKVQQAQLEDFVTTHEQSFSLLGWFTKLFVKTDA